MRSPVVNVGHLWSNIDVWKAGELCLNPIAPNTVLEHRRYIIYDQNHLLTFVVGKAEDKVAQLQICVTIILLTTF